MDKINHHTRSLFGKDFRKVIRLTPPAVILCMLIFLSGCLDIPDTASEGIFLERVDILVFQDGNEDSTLLKIRPTDSALVAVSTYPRQFKHVLTFNWLYRTDDSSSVIGEGIEYTIPFAPEPEDIPNAIRITDDIGNTLTYEFEIVVNMKPVLEPATIPADGDTLYGNRTTAIKFKWNSYDIDDFDVNSLEHELIIDNVSYSVGLLNEVMQSGFDEGGHTFQVIVRDSFGDADTLPARTFYIVDTLGRSR